MEIFMEIHDRYYAKIKKFILAFVKDEWAADDLTQETFFKAQKELGTLRDPSKLSSWLFRIAYNLCQEYFRRPKMSHTEEEGMQDRTECHVVVPIHKELQQRQMGECVQDKMGLLSDSHRTILVLSDVMEYSYQEIADILGITVENVKVRIHRARKRLKAILQKKCSFEVDERGVLACDPKEIKT